MGGTIFAESTLGEGSKFWFQITFPLVIEKISQPTETGEIPIFISDPPKKILIADDIRHNRIILHEFLTLFQCDTQLAKDGNDCIQKALETKPDLILMDIQMPMMDGIQALKLIKKQDEIKHIPVIAVSASITGKNKQAIIQEGFDDFISKPVDMDELATIIQKHLDVDIQYVKLDNLSKKSMNEINPKTIKKTKSIEIIKKLPILDIKKALSNLRNDDVLFQQILELAIEDIPNYLNSLKHDFDKREPENIKQQAHKLKSSFQLIAAKRCEALVDLISHKSIKMEYESADIHALEIEWHRLVQQVKQMIQGQKI